MRIGIFGGAFDPIHSEHLNIVKTALNELSLDKLLIIPTYSPPHKKDATISYEHRINMAKLVFNFDDRLEVSDIESRLPDGYSTTLVDAIKSEYQCDTIFIMGGDSLEFFLTWHDPMTLIKSTRFAVVEREGNDNFKTHLKNLVDNYSLQADVLSYVGKEISSSVIQAELEIFSYSKDIPESALKYIQSNGLYCKYRDFVNELRNNMSEKTFNHVVRTCLYAMKFRSELKLDFDEVFIATMLHDIAKNRVLPKIEGVPDPVVHQYEGERIAREEFGIKNDNILKAIRTHTTGDANMSDLQKLVYVADTLEPYRDYDGVDILRQAVFDDFQKGFVKVVQHTYNHLISNGGEIDSLTKKCLEYYQGANYD